MLLPLNLRPHIPYPPTARNPGAGAASSLAESRSPLLLSSTLSEIVLDVFDSVSPGAPRSSDLRKTLPMLQRHLAPFTDDKS